MNSDNSTEFKNHDHSIQWSGPIEFSELYKFWLVCQRNVAESSCDNSEMQFPDNASDRELNSDDVDVPVTETVEIDTSKDTSKVAMVYSMNVSK